MTLQTLTYIVVGATFALYIGIAFWARASTTGEFYAAGRGVHPVANGMATAADWMSAASFISMAGLIAYNGYGASVFLMGCTGVETVADELRYGELTELTQVGCKQQCQEHVTT